MINGKTEPLNGSCIVEYGTRVVQKRDGGDVYPVYGGGGATFKMDTFNREDRLVISRFGMSEECTRFVHGKFFLNDSGLTVSPKDGELLPRFLDYQLFSLNDTIFALGKGSAQKNLDVPSFRDLPIFIPSDITAQKRIVRILDEAFDGIATAKENALKNLQNAREVFESHLQNVFTQHDSSHVVKRLDEVCTEITVGHVGPMVKQYRYTGIPFLRSQNIRPFRVSLENVVFIDEKFHRALVKSQLRPGDVAVVRTGYPGTAAVIPDSLPISNCSDLVIVRPGPAADPNYLALFFNSRLGKELVAGRLVGAAQKHFNITTAKQVAISFPPVPEQRRLAAKITEFGTETHCLESIYQRKLAALEELKKSLLQQAFNGEL